VQITPCGGAAWCGERREAKVWDEMWLMLKIELERGKNGKEKI
jgi:hypothetical protein